MSARAGETAFLRRHDAALRRYGEDKSSGSAGRIAQEAHIERARASLARLWGVSQGDIGFVANVAEGVSIVADSIDWRDGDNICIDAHEYPSVVGPFALRRNPRVVLRTASGTQPDRVAALVNERTRLIGVSAVSYLTGERFDLQALRRAADSAGALLVVDYTQAAGYLPIDASTTPRDSARHGGSVCVASSRAAEIVEVLNHQGVYAWNGHGRVRFSFHGYNTATDMDRIVAALRPVWGD